MIFHGTASQPVSFDLDMPAQSPAGAVLSYGWWKPYLGGAGGESGQAYTSQWGMWVKLKQQGEAFSVVFLWASGQFSAKGTIIGSLQLKGLPFPTGNVPTFMPGVCGWYSNMTPNMAQTPIIIPQTSGNRSSLDLYAPSTGYPQLNPRPMSGDDLNPATQFCFHFTHPCSEAV